MIIPRHDILDLWCMYGQHLPFGGFYRNSQTKYVTDLSRPRAGSDDDRIGIYPVVANTNSRNFAVGNTRFINGDACTHVNATSRCGSSPSLGEFAIMKMMITREMDSTTKVSCESWFQPSYFVRR